MILETVYSVNNVPIRLTDERWYEHILAVHPGLTSYYDTILDAVENPEYILRGNGGALIAVVTMGKKSYLHVMYKEISENDGLIITAFFKTALEKRKILWRRDD